MWQLSEFEQAIHREGGVSRRLFLGYAAALSAMPWLGRQSRAAMLAQPSFASDPFTLGVASGDPTETGVVLWTRLAPHPLEPDGGMPPAGVEVQWEIAQDEALKNVIARGTEVASPELGHSVHVEVEGLQPDRWYWYRFRAGDAVSPIGRTRTFPDAVTLPDKLRFAFASCQHFEQGLFTAYQHMAQDELDLVVHLGDYIYEYPGKDKRVRKHVGQKLTTLDDYRVRHAQYHTDEHLQAMHGRCPWLVTWDDHEFENNYANSVSERKNVDPAQFLLQRASSYQAYYENLPLRKTAIPQGPHMQLYRKSSFGRLAEFQVLDTRQYRSDQPNNDRASDLTEAALSPSQTLLGTEQKQWLKNSLQASRGVWNILAQQVMMGMFDSAVGDAGKYSMDQWPGYAHERMELMRFFADAKISNPVVLTGDIHSSWVNDLRVDDRKHDTPVVATEFVGTSISSGGNGVEHVPNTEGLQAENPFVKFHSQQRGYVRCTVTPAEWRSDFVVVEKVTEPGSPAINRASFVVEQGKPGAVSL